LNHFRTNRRSKDRTGNILGALIPGRWHFTSRRLHSSCLRAILGFDGRFPARFKGIAELSKRMQSGK